MVYMKGQVENSKCVELIWYECEGKLIICESKFWGMVRYPWGVAKIYLIKENLMVLNRDL